MYVILLCDKMFINACKFWSTFQRKGFEFSLPELEDIVPGQFVLKENVEELL